jgi:hypothetical protein
MAETQKANSVSEPTTELSWKDRLELREKRRQNHISILSIAATFAIAMTSLLWNARIQKQATTTSDAVETSRVENDEVKSNSNANDFHNPWRQWQESVSPSTVYLGIERVVPFQRRFRSAPQVTLGMSLIDVPPMDLILFRFGFKPAEPKMSERIRHFHVVTKVADVTREHFILQLGIGLPTEAAKVLVEPLSAPLNLAVDREFIDNMRLYRELENRSDSLTPGETWLINFYRIVGTIDVTWIAQE